MRDVLTSIGDYDWTVSEFIRITQHVLPVHVFYKFVPELQHQGNLQGKTKHGTPVHVQLLGSDPELLAGNAVKAVALGALAIDLNFGCPAKTVNSHRWRLSATHRARNRVPNYSCRAPSGAHGHACVCQNTLGL